MSGEDWESGDEHRGRPFGARPFGVRPFGVRPFGVRPFGVRPFGVRPFGVRQFEEDAYEERPFGVRPFGVRPFGPRPFGPRAFGPRPFGPRPFGPRPFGPRPFGPRGGALDLEEWSADIAELVCARSAVITLGATVVADEYELRVPAVDATPGAPKYIEDEGDEKPLLKPRESKLRPRDHELAAKVVLPDRVARDIDRDELLALAVKEDLAEALALRADQAFLAGAGAQPTGISNVVPGVAPGANLLITARTLVEKIRTVAPLLNPVFRAPGWVIHPATLDELTKTPAGPAGSTVDMVRNLLCHDGTDGGELLGYPFVVSAAAYDGAVRKIYFSADWREAWIGIDEVVATIDISTHVHFQTDETVIRATMAHDFALRRPDAFTWAEHKGTAKRAAPRSRKSSRSRS